LKILNLVKISLEEYINWDETDICGDFFTDILSRKDVSQKNRENVSAKNLDLQEQLNSLKKEVDFCKRCQLWENRLNAVFGSGRPDADLMFVGEGPGYDEDHKGEPFIGKAGQLLTKIIEAMGQTRETVYIANIVKCHPMIDPLNPQKRANDRPPNPDEMQACEYYLDMQLKIIKPKIIVTLGASSTKWLLKSDESISKIRGFVREYKGIKLMPTYHPAALLRNSSLKKFVWQDLRKVMHFLNTGEI
jgi:DNA polymerase